MTQHAGDRKCAAVAAPYEKRGDAVDTMVAPTCGYDLKPDEVIAYRSRLIAQRKLRSVELKLEAANALRKRKIMTSLTIEAKWRALTDSVS